MSETKDDPLFASVLRTIRYIATEQHPPNKKAAGAETYALTLYRMLKVYDTYIPTVTKEP